MKLEQIEILERLVKGWIDTETEILRTQLAAAEARIGVLESILRWYADESNYATYAKPPVGDRARAALAGKETT